jgi:protocatechuate 3,4-dioxygenase beta subunit
VEGTVVSATTGEPLKKAHVFLHPLGQQNGIPYGTTTDSAGHFLLDGIDPGRYSFLASRNGFIAQEYSPKGDPRQTTSLTLAPGQKLKEIVFKLIPQAVMSGRVLDEDGEPVAEAQVRVSAFVYQRGKRQLSGQNEASTNDLGEFRLYGLSPGKYVISATRQSWEQGVPERTVGAAQAVQSAQEGYATTYYPHSTNPENAAPIEITAGAQVSGINISLARVRTVSVKGRVNGIGASRSNRNGGVMLISRDTQFGMPIANSRITDSQGSFLLQSVPPGSYVLRADYMDDGKRYGARLPLEVGDSNLEGIELILQPPAEVHGHVIIEEHGDLQGEVLRVQLQLRNPGLMMWGGFAQVKDDLSFTILNAGLDSYDVNVYGMPEGFYLKSIRTGQQDITEKGFDLTSGTAADDLTIVLNPNGGVMEGSVKNAKDESAMGATVTLIPDPSHRSLTRLYKTANTDQNGHFIIKGISPGEYKIYAWEDLEQGAYEDPDFVKPHESAGETVNIKERSHETVQLKAIPAESTGNQKPDR